MFAGVSAEKPYAKRRKNRPHLWFLPRFSAVAAETVPDSPA